MASGRPLFSMRPEVTDFPAFIITDDKGNDFFAALAH
jgi:tartrate dehydratase beta subunit/fumarate hydratase class I family protein